MLYSYDTHEYLWIFFYSVDWYMGVRWGWQIKSTDYEYHFVDIFYRALVDLTQSVNKYFWFAFMESHLNLSLPTLILSK